MKQNNKKQEHNTCEKRIQHDILLKKLKKKKKKNKNMTQKNVHKACVEHIKDNKEFYFYLYPLSTKLKKVFQEISNLYAVMSTNAHQCAPMCEL